MIFPRVGANVRMVAMVTEGSDKIMHGIFIEPVAYQEDCPFPCRLWWVPGSCGWRRQTGPTTDSHS